MLATARPEATTSTSAPAIAWWSGPVTTPCSAVSSAGRGGLGSPAARLPPFSGSAEASGVTTGALGAVGAGCASAPSCCSPPSVGPPSAARAMPASSAIGGALSSAPATRAETRLAAPTKSASTAPRNLRQTRVSPKATAPICANENQFQEQYAGPGPKCHETCKGDAGPIARRTSATVAESVLVGGGVDPPELRHVRLFRPWGHGGGGVGDSPLPRPTIRVRLSPGISAPAGAPKQTDGFCVPLERRLR